MKTKHYALLLAPVCVIGVLLRLFEILFAVDKQGFYTQNSIIPIIFNIFTAIVIIFFLSALVLVKKEKKPIVKRYSRITILEKIAMGAAAISILLSSFLKFIALMPPIGEPTDPFRTQAPEDVLFSLPFLMLFFSLLICIFVLSYVISPSKTINKISFKAASLAFTGYYVVRLFEIFIDQTSMLSRVYTTYTILFLSFATLFFMNFTKMLAEVPAKKFMISFGFSAVFLGFIRIIEFVIGLMPNNIHGLSIDPFAYIADFFVMFAILAITLRLIFRRHRKKDLDIVDVKITTIAPIIITEVKDNIPNSKQDLD